MLLLLIYPCYVVFVPLFKGSFFQVFEPFGLVELVQLPVDPLTGLCKGFGFIQVSSDMLTYSHAALLLDI